MLYSQDLSIYKEELPLSINDAIIEIKQFLQINDVRILRYDKFNLAIPITLDICLPSKGTHQGVDIRNQEPILLFFNLRSYPTSSPRIKSDRKDFPTSELSHLYVVCKGVPPTLCLVREDLDEWFANRRISDLISVGIQWFSKAASGLLTEDADEFEPIRLEGYKGYAIYPYNKVSNKIINENRHYKEYPFCYLLFTINYRNLLKPSFRYVDIDINSSNLIELYKILGDFNLKFIKRKDCDVDLALFGLLVWSKSSNTISNYNTSLPKTYIELESFADENAVSIKEPIRSYIKDRLSVNNLTTYIPVVIGIKRPKKLIGFESNIEFLHFVLKITNDSIIEDSISPETKVFFQSHREPISSTLAQKLSVSNNHDKTVFIGAGALGSKLIFHYARSGNFNLKVIDNDRFSPHNIVRHDLFMDSSGINKAKAVISKIKSFLDENSSLEFFEGSIFNLDKTKLEGFNWLIDTSASLNVQNWLVNTNLDIIPNRARAEIAYKGSLGFLYIEGENQNPRLDDLVNYVFFLGTKINKISEWLIEENKKKEGYDYDIVDIGIGCNSPTVIMSNDSMSYHASIFSKILNSVHDRTFIENQGLLNISYISTNGFDINSNSFLLPKFDVYKCQNNSGWEIRFMNSVIDKMKIDARKHRRNETGGIFIGICNYKTKTIHVFDTILAPRDSKRSRVYFFRGIENLPEQVKHIKEITGGMIGYIGEWHTHPMGLDSLSCVDLQAVDKLKPLNDKYPIPTFVSVLSKEKFLPFVF